MILLVLLLSASTPNIDCSKVRWFVQTYGQDEAMRIGRKNFGYSEEAIKRIAKRCHLKTDT